MNSSQLVLFLVTIVFVHSAAEKKKFRVSFDYDFTDQRVDLCMAFDSNKDGFMDRNELPKCLVKLGEGPAPEYFVRDATQALLYAFDGDEDGRLTAKELKNNLSLHDPL